MNYWPEVLQICTYLFEGANSFSFHGKSKRYDVWYVVRVPNSRKDCVHCHRKSSVMFVYVQLHIIINGRGGMLGLMPWWVRNEDECLFDRYIREGWNGQSVSIWSKDPSFLLEIEDDWSLENGIGIYCTLFENKNKVIIILLDIQT